MPLLYNQCGYLFRWVGAFPIREADHFILHSDMGITYPFHSPHFVWPCLLWPSSVIGHIPLWVHYWPVSMGIDIIPSALHMCSFQSLQPGSLYLWSSPVLSGCSGRCPWCKLQLPIFPPQGSFTGRSLGDCLTTFLLWCPLFITSDRGSLAWGGAGTPVLCMMAAHTHGNANL